MFQQGQDLCRGFYREVLSPAIDVPHSAGLLGPGSDVLGYDTERSTDHDWGPRAVIFVDAVYIDDVTAAIAAVLPDTYCGWDINIGRDGGPLAPQVEVTTLAGWLGGQFGFDPTAQPLTAIDWLALPQQRLLGVVKGSVFSDGLNVLGPLRRTLAWYPDDVWWWILACHWRRLAQEEPFVQRTAEAGDDAGAALIAARQVRDCMRLTLLMAREYAPYSKWLGTAFSRLAHSDGLDVHLAAVMKADDAMSRERKLGRAYECLARRFNDLEPGLDVDTTLRPFHDRPAEVLGADRFVDAAAAMVNDPMLSDLPLIGAVDQWVDSTDVLASPSHCAQFRQYYSRLAGGVQGPPA